MANYTGDADNNVYTGTSGADTISGAGGDDTLSGLGGNDIINGDSGDDLLDGGDGDDLLNGGDGNDEIITGTGNDTVVGGDGADYIDVGANLNALDRIDGSVDGGSSIDVMSIYGIYNDYILFDADTVRNVERFSIGSGQVKLTLHAQTNVTWIDAGGQLQTDFLYLNGAAATNAMQITGGAGNDIITGGSGPDIIIGGLGQDVLNGGAGNDQIIGGLDGDTLSGGAGNDVFTFTYNTPRSDSSPSTIDTILDFEGAGVTGGDKIDLPGYAYGRGIVFNATPIDFTFVVGGGASGVQLPAALVGDGFADVVWKNNSSAGRVELWVDVDDNGQFSELDIYTYINGATSLTQEDFTDTFPVWRGTLGNDTLLASAGAITAYGLGGNDNMRGGDGNDVLFGGEGADVIRGGNDSDSLSGGDGNDTIYGDAGNDNIGGGAGDDVLIGGAGYDYIYGEDGNDIITAGTAGSYVDAGYGNDTVTGSAVGDNLYGSYGNDTINAGAGDDIVDGSYDNDILNGEAGNDTINGSYGDDVITGGDGNDTLSGTYGINSINAGAGDDIVAVGTEANSRDTVTGGTGADTFRLSSYWLYGSFSAPHVITDFNRTDGDKLSLIHVDSDNNGAVDINGTPLVFRGELSSSLYYDGAPLPGSDLGSGFTQVWWSRIGSGGTAKTVLIIDSDRDLTLTSADYVVEFAPGTIADVQLSDFAGSHFQAFAGTAGDDSYTGNAGNNLIYGLLGNDTLSGQDGNDTITGNDGNDTLYGDAGNDNLNGGAGADILYGGNDSDSLSGGDGNDTIYGDAGNDNIGGGAGDDVLIGGAGYDYIYGEDGNDIITAGTAGSYVDAGYGNDTVTGSAVGDNLYGSYGNDTINAGAGDDIVDGSYDNDILNGEAGNDTINGSYGDDVITGGDGNDTLSGTYGINSINAGAGDDIVAVGTEANSRDTVTGGTGADTFRLSSFWLYGSFAAPHVITDFNRTDGDKLSLIHLDSDNNGAVDINGTPLVFRGELSSALYYDGAPLPGSDLGTGFTQVWWSRIGSGGTAKTVLIFDFDRDLTLTSADYVVELAPGTIADVQLSDFAGNHFQRIIGTPQDNVFEDTDDAHVYYGVDGNDTINGNGGNDTLVGGAGVDIITGGQGNDSLYGGTGDDNLNGGVGTDSLYGEDGDDLIRGGDDADYILGGAGSDELHGEFGADTIYGEGGDDRIYGGADNDYISAGDGADYVEAGDGDDTVDGGYGADRIVGGAGNDNLNGSYDDDILEGGEGNDTLIGSYGWDMASYANSNQAVIIDLSAASNVYALGGNSGTDTLIDIEGIIGSAFNDTLIGTDGDNVFEGGAGNDWLEARGGVDTLSYVSAAAGITISLASTAAQVTGGAGTDTISGFENVTGSAYNDVITGSTANNLLLTGAGDDRVFAGDGEDIVRGGDGADVLRGENGDDQVYGDAGNDTLLGGIGLDLLYGGEGDDNVKGEAGNDRLYGEAGDDLLEGGEGDDLLLGGEGSDTATYVTAAAGVTVTLGIALAQDTVGAGTDTLGGIENLTGSAYADLLTGDAGANILTGGGGDDTLDGAAGADRMVGGLGNDIYLVDDAGDVVAESANQGDDLVRTTLASYTLGNNVERLTGLASTGQTLTGNSLANTITGGSGNDVLNGGTGADTLIGGLGDDVYIIDNAGDSITELAGEGTDEVRTSLASYTLGAALENLTGTLATGQTLTGNGLGNIIRGGVGADTMTGGLGDDVYYVNNLADKVVENSGQGFDVIFSSVTYGLAGRNIEQLTLTGSGDINATGNSLSNSLVGNIGANILNGGGGDDIMAGGLGNDLYYVDEAGDVVIELVAQGVDEVRTTLTSYVLAANVENLIGVNAAGQSLTGNAQANDITGSTGNDIIDGGALADTMTGGLGDDIYYVDHVLDKVVEANGEGSDTIFASVSYGLAGRAIEQLTLVGNDNINATGNSLVNSLTGNSGANILNGGGGADTMAGGLGDDTYYVDDTGDKVIEASGQGYDTIFSTVTYNLNNRAVEQLTLTGTANINASGNTLANGLTGNSGANVLDGGAGADTLTGGAGQDQFRFSTALGTSNVDQITDFSVADDTVVLSSAIFAAAGPAGTLNAGAFVIGSAAADAGDRIIYNSATGTLFYDADGTGAGAAVAFAQIGAGLSLTNADFLIG
ncbi:MULTISPECIES: hypothetical protein [unclassified Sphingobium]|uniref:hypothetical protein n=1 Tax=unclassified Sphingobium TaxID=2611147 RepID=UPI0035A580E6